MIVEKLLKDARRYAISHYAEVSIDLYYNDYACRGCQYVARVYSGLDDIPLEHFRCGSFLRAAALARKYVLDQVKRYYDLNYGRKSKTYLLVPKLPFNT